MKSKRIVVIGGSAAGPKAAARAKRLDQDAQVVLLQKDPELSMASCGYPYYIGGTFDDRNQLICTPTGVVRDPGFFAKAKGVEAMVRTEVTEIDPKAKTVSFSKLDSNETGSLEYDKLIICTGASPRVPPIPGRELAGITPLHAMRDADALHEAAAQAKGKKAIIVGGGLIGIETCEAFAEKGLDVTVVELLPQILMFLDPEMAKLVENHVKAKGVNIITNNGVAEFIGENGHVSAVKLNDGTTLPCDVAVVAIGVVPNVRLAKDAGLGIGKFGGIEVNEFMQTTDPDIYASGDCVELTNRITGQKTLAPYGDLANLEGRVAAENAVKGNSSFFPGTIHSGICKVFDFTAATTGLSEERARQAGFDVVSATNAGLDRPGFMGAKLLVSKMVADAKTGRLLGFQIVGPGEVNRQVAEAAVAVMAGMSINDLAVADLPYAPPYSLAIDHFITSAHILQNKMNGLMTGVTNREVKAKLDAGEKLFFLDVRSPEEFAQMELGIGEKLIPLGALRSKMSELPEDKNAEIITYCKISMRGYEAQQVLHHAGYSNVTVMEGGVMAWPYGRKK
ncbi:FAD-dependent oxidoreductase [Desulfovibrio inopinatus]|uniref:FAD-dependent oxidoreductase n=1 Tax=Desulfovibrio inopinatus TaxID=102109 RepID=UPI000416ED6E|nr:FAD-dependent oxidoreductase [Desulfovibrio inopinatus]